MTLTYAALNVLSASQSGSLDRAEVCLLQMNSMVATVQEEREIVSVLAILQQARAAMLAHRADIAESLQNLENSSLYRSGSELPAASWEIAG